VSISKPRITLKGAQSGRISASRQTNTPDPTIESVIVQNPNTTGVTIYADNVTVDGFYLKEVSIFPGFTQEPAESTSGLRVQNNVFAISTNSFGGMLLLGLQSSTITNNIFFSLDPPNAPAYRGIYSYGLLSNVSISNNIFSGMVGAIFILNSDGVEQNAAAASGKKKRRISVSINGNNFRYTALDPSLDTFPAYGVELADVTNAVIANNGFSAVLRGGSGYRGIVLANGVADTQVSNNLIYVNNGTPASSTSPVDVGIYVNNLPVEVGGPINVPTTGNVLQNNSIDGDLAYGISLVGTTSNLLQGNLIQNNGADGIHLEDADNNTITRNSSDNHADDGLDIDATSENNQVSRNSFRGNADFDIEDSSSGGYGTGGTSNYYTNNTAASTSFD
jgi:parallel beta-helix repeat protein